MGLINILKTGMYLLPQATSTLYPLHLLSFTYYYQNKVGLSVVREITPVVFLQCSDFTCFNH